MASNGGHELPPTGHSNGLMAAPAANGLQHQQQTPVPWQGHAKGTEHAGLLYDLSSFDPLQAHAMQLTASAGMTNLLAPHPPVGQLYNAAIAPGGAPGQISQQYLQAGQQAQGQQAQGQHTPQTALISQLSQPQHAQHTMPQQQAAFYYVQHPNGAPASLQPIAPAAQQVVASALTPQAAPQSFLLPASTQGAALTSAPAAYQQQLFPNTLACSPGAPPGVLPNILMTQHLQSVVANAAHHPAPLAPAIAPLMKRENEEYNPLEQNTNKKQKQRGLAPSIVSSSTNSTGNSNAMSNAAANMAFNQMDKPPQEASQTDLDKMTPAERRRYERNLREQQRSYKISQQIKELREVLSESNVPFKPNKYAILMSVVEYIKQLQSRAIMLDAEHQKLITTIRQTNDLVNSGSTPTLADETDATNRTGVSETGSDADMLFVQGLDYRSLFEQCPAALGIAALDGRILECNPEFQLLLGFPKDDLLKQSLFNLVRNHQDIFRAMAEMLKGAEISVSGGEKPTAIADNRFWNGAVVSKHDTKLAMNLTLTLADDGSPKFFNCALTTTA